MFHKKILIGSILIVVITLVGLLFSQSKDNQQIQTQPYREESQEGVPKKDRKETESKTIDSFVEKKAQSPQANTLSQKSTVPSIGGLSTSDIEKKQLEPLKKSEIHIGWMTRLESILGDTLSQETKELFREYHLLFLHASDELKNKYLSNLIDRQTYFLSLSELFERHQSLYKTMLTDRDYEQLFEVNKEETNDTIKETLYPTPEEPEIYNPDTTLEEVYQKIPENKIKELINLVKERELNKASIDERYASEQLTEEEALKEFEENNKQYIKKSKSILAPEEFKLIFGTPTNSPQR